MRKLLVLLVVGSFALLAGCGSGSGGGTPAGIPTTITLSPSVGQSINSGASISITATVTTGSSNSSSVTWSLSGPGSLSSTSANPVTYTAPSSVTTNTPVAVIATSGSGSNYLPLTVLPSGATNTNRVALTVDGGPAPPYPNGVFTSVNICAPGTNTCQTVDHVLVDTGSFGLRILQSVLTSSLSLPDLVDSNNNPIFNCVAFLDGSFLWGPVAEADLRFNGEVAGAALLQVISSSNSNIPTACTNGGTVNENTPQLLAANGILGIGPEPTDCELSGANLCDGSLGQIIPAYFSCPSGTCSTGTAAITIPESSQVVNPTVLFATDNNGVAVSMQALSGVAPSATGSMTFGIGTQSNNALGSATILTFDASDSFETNFDGENLTSSFIDSGSNGFFFSNFVANIPTCSVNTSFFCPASTLSLTATNTGTNNAVSTVGFKVDNADNLFNNNPGDEAFSNLAGPQNSTPPAACNSDGSGDCTFDFGLPFFYGRTIFTAIDGQNAPSATPPWVAY